MSGSACYRSFNPTGLVRAHTTMFEPHDGQRPPTDLDTGRGALPRFHSCRLRVSEDSGCQAELPSDTVRVAYLSQEDSVIRAFIFGVPIPVARSYPGVVGNRPLLLVVWPTPVMSWK